MSGAPERRGSARGRGLRRLAALALGLALAPVAAELAYRLARVSDLGPTTHPELVRHDAELGWAYRPGASVRHRANEFDVEVAIHSRGFRGPEWELDGPGLRVLVLGDSFAFGWGVEQEERFSALLAARGWRVFGAAVSGYGTDQELLLLRRLAPELRPDAVVVAHCGNDGYESCSPVAYGARKPWFELEGGRLALRGQPVQRPFLQRHSLLARALAKLSWERRFAATPRDLEAERRITRALVGAMRAELPPGVPLLFVSEEAGAEELAGGRAGIGFLDLRPALAAVPGPERFPVDGHWNASGHAAVAEALDTRLRELLPRAAER